jgi:rhodanese-related sulfurtransferase
MVAAQIQRASNAARPNPRTKSMFPEGSLLATPVTPPASTLLSEISVAELATRLHSAAPPLLAEILGAQYFASGHLPGALNLALEAFVENAVRALPDKTREIVVYCASATCQNSDIAARKLHSLGYAHVRVFKGGKAAWRDAGHPLVT